MNFKYAIVFANSENLDGPHVRFSRVLETLDKINNLQLFIGYEFMPDEQGVTE